MILKRSDIDLAERSILKTKLENEGQLSNDLLNNIEDFISGSVGELRGDSWDIIRRKYFSAVNALKMRKEIASDFFTLISNVNNKLYDYLDLEGASEADDSKIPEIEQQLTQAEADLAVEKAGHTFYNSEKGDYDTYINEAEIARLEALIATLKRILEWLKNLAPTIAETNATLYLNYSAITSYYNAILQMDE